MPGIDRSPEISPPWRRVVLLAGSFGRTIAREVDAASSRCQFLKTPSGESVVKPLLAVADLSILNQWIMAIKCCPRLQPLAKKLFIVVNDDHYQHYCDWAQDPKQSLGGFPVDNIINNGSKLTDAQRPGDAADLALAVRTMGAEGWVFAASADYCFEPLANLQHFVEHAVVSGRNAVAYCPACAQSLQSGAELECDEDGGSHARVTRASLAASPRSAATSIPFVGLKQSSLHELEAFARESAAQGPWQSLERFVVKLSESSPLTGVRFQTVFSVRTLRDLLFTDMFFAHWNNRMVENIKSHRVRGTKDVPKDTIFGSGEGEIVPTAASPTKLDIVAELADFQFDVAEALVNRSKFAGSDITLPKRFTQSGQWNYDKRRKEHPCYTTSTAAYGAKNPNAADMPMAWHGVHGEFTTTFKGMTRDKGLRCFTEVSKVHKAFDEFTHYR